MQVLVVDDNRRIADLLRRIALDCGFEAEAATNANYFLQQYESQEPDLILLDVFMPEMDGFERLVGRTLGERMKIAMGLSDDLWSCHVDCRQLENALLNLAINARDAMPHGGTIVFETKNAILDKDYCDRHADVIPGEYVMVAVSDTGVGMMPEVIAKAFDPFFTTKAMSKGTGLGLSMVYGFIKQSRGHIKIYSEPGHGTTIKMYLPRHLNHDENIDYNDDADGGDDNHPETANIKVLVVEDNKDVLKVTSTMIDDLGYDYMVASSAEDALKIIRSHPDFNLLLSDVVLSGEKNGPDLAEIAREMIPDIKILFNSGYAEHAIFKSGILPDDVHLISKPFRKKDLGEKIIEVLKEG